VSQSPSAEPGLAAELRGILLAAGFTGEGVRAALGTHGTALSGSVDVPLYLRRLEGVEPLGTLVRLLVLEAPVALDAARRAFAPLALERLEKLGLLSRGSGEVVALFRIAPHDEVLIASDRHTEPGEDRPDHVAGVHGPSLTLSHLTVRRPVDTALDVGTGNGIQAILAARHSGRVVATDLNPRALEFAAFNAELNEVENVELRAGSFFEPVEGSRFGLVTSNPPYVISPESAYLFRDSGQEGDAVSRGIVASAPALLEEDGFATLLVSWAAEPDGDWSSPLRSWVEGSGCDAWLLHYRTEDLLTHSGNWLRHEVGSDPTAYAAAIERWLAYYERLGIEGIAVGAVILRRRSGQNWIRADELPADRLGPASDHILRVFAAGDYLAGSAGQSDLLGRRLIRAPSAHLEQRGAFEDGQWQAVEFALTLEDGLGFRAALDPGAAAMLAALDGERTLREVAGDEAVAQAMLPVAREMLAAGFLVLQDPLRV
jgi:methylase of polypeptide subunit release factors